MRKHKNAEDRPSPFLSESRGDVTVDVPNRVNTSNGEWAFNDPNPPVQEPVTQPRMYGGRSGRGKTVTVK